MSAQPSKLRERVYAAAEAVLAAGGSVGPLEVLQQMSLLASAHVQAWRQGRIAILQPLIQGSPDKLAKSFQFFQEWAQERRLKPVPASYLRTGVDGQEVLKVTAEGDPVLEKFFRTHFAPADLSERKARQLEKKLTKAPDLVVFQTVAESVKCTECTLEMTRGDMLCMEKGQPLCLVCADLDHLEYLPSGDAALSRRSRKHSSLSAVVVRFSRTRGRYERQGLLASPEAIARAEAECAADAPERAAQRAKGAVRRKHEDAEFVTHLTKVFCEQYPGCPPAEAAAIAQHTALRGSGRVGRSAAARALDEGALRAAVVAHVRHVHTEYDALLMRGTDRQEARGQVRPQIDSLLAKWQRAPVPG